jgi:hypothetical protein
MGCDYLWTAAYVNHLDPRPYDNLGWTDEQIVMWQYAGDSTNMTRSPHLPNKVPGMGLRDCSVFRHGDLALFKSILIKR